MTTDEHLDADPVATEPRERRPRPVTIAASALALGALALPEPARLAPVPRHLLRLARSGYVGWYTWGLTRRGPLPYVPPQAFGALAGAGLTLAGAPIDEATDAWVTEQLRRRGVRRPRLLMALAGAGMGALFALDSQARPEDDEELRTPEDFFEAVEVPAAGRALVEVMAEAAADRSQGEVVRQQLDAARASVLAGGVPTTDIFLEVPEGTARLVPHAQTWPVRGHFEAHDLPLRLELQIGEGRLAGLSIMLRDEDLTDDDERWEVELLDVITDWPTPEQVRWVVETPEGIRPVG